MNLFKKRYRKFLAVIILIAGAAIFLSFISPEKIVGSLGVKNIYAYTFFLAIIGGVSALTATGFYTAIFAFAAGGANPFILAAFSAPGVLIGDLVFWYAGLQAKIIAKDALGKENFFNKFHAWLAKKPPWLVPLIIYAYTGLTPLPGDFLMITLALIGFPLRRIIIPTLLGNYTLALLVAFSSNIY